MRMVLGLLVIAGIALCGCGDDDDKSVNAPFVEEYVGTYMVRDLTIAMSEKMDSVKLTVTDGQSYSLRFWELGPSDAQVEFCDCEGRITTNTSSILGFEPTVQIETNCDYLRVPRGDFVADYATHRPDTIYFVKSFGDSLFQLIVIEK